MATMQERVEAIKKHALDNYGDGWDVIVECYDDADIEEMLAVAHNDWAGEEMTVEDAIRYAGEMMAIREGVRRDVCLSGDVCPDCYGELNYCRCKAEAMGIEVRDLAPDPTRICLECERVHETAEAARDCGCYGK